MKRVKPDVLNKIKRNNSAIGRLMIAFDRGQNTIYNWIDSNDVRLTTPYAVEIIQDETGIKDILEPVEEYA